MSISIKKAFNNLLILTIIISFISTIFFKANIYAEETTKTAKNLDVVLVMDKSKSMDKSDQDKISLESAKMFIDMLKESGANLSVIEYSNNCESEGMMPVKDNKEKLKQNIDGIEFVGTATDTGAALLQAVDVLSNNGNPENKKSIILFSDGKVAIKRDGRTTEDSKKDIETSIEKCRASNLSIYSVGLINQMDSVADINEFESQMKNIAENTNGKYTRAENVNDLPQFFSELLQTLDGIKGDDLGVITANGDYQTVNFTISNSNILEANILLLHDKEILDVKLIGPDGKEVDLNSDSFLYTKSSKYTLIKMLKPQKGDWSMKIKGVANSTIKVNLIYNYDLELVSTVSKNSASKGDKVTLNAYFEYENKKLEDKNFYGTIEATAIVRNAKNNKEEKIKLNYQEDGYIGEITLDEYGEYYLTVHTLGQGMDKYSSEMQISCENQAPQVSNLDEKMDIKINDTLEIDLAEYIKDPENDEISFNVSNSNNDIISVKLEGSILKIASNNTGKSDIEIIATDKDGKEVKFTVNVDSYDPTKKYIMIGGLILLLLIIIAIIIFVNKRSKKMKGYLLMSIDSFENYNYENFIVENVQINGNSKTLQNILSSAHDLFRAISSPDEADKLSRVIGTISSQSSKVIFKAVGKKGDDVYKINIENKNGKSVGLASLGSPEFGKKSIQVDASKFDTACTIKFKLNNSESDYVEIKITISKKIPF